ncbi:hypothetical protein U1769_16840 [Sphingomonas sp. ZT3P38]|uniref:hypothetical protein n=1 Tax=Parasphingomonas zepuensis TaxID=3096161 RepID=UPI002FC74727
MLILAAAGVAAWLALAPSPAPAGTVLATVDGIAVTNFDLAAEAATKGLTAEQIDDPMQKALLAQIIDRKLLAAAARNRGVGSDPLYRASVARAGEMVAAKSTAQEFTGPPQPAGDAESKRFMAANPLMFQQRQILTIDGVMVDPRNAYNDRINAANTLDEVIALMRMLGISFERVQQRLDTAAIPRAVAMRLLQAKPGDLFRLPAGEKSLIGAVIARQPLAVPERDQLAAARSAAGQQQQQRRLGDALAALRAKAQIRYK